MGRVFEHSRSTGAARLVLLAIADAAADSGEVSAYGRSHSFLGYKANVNEKTVKRAIRDLVGLGELAVTEEGTGRTQASYFVTLAEGGRDAPPGGHAPPGGARCPPWGGEMPPLGGRDAPPIIPSFPMDIPSKPQPATADAADAMEVPSLNLALVDAPTAVTDPVRMVFAAWVSATNRHERQTKLTPDRRKLIEKWLKSYSAADLIDATHGIVLSPFHMGKNDRGEKYDGLGHVLKNAEMIERFRDYVRNPETIPKPPAEHRTGPRVEENNWWIDARAARDA
jgi:hypothetical protein